jgi:hypothetical protein
MMAFQNRGFISVLYTNLMFLRPRLAWKRQNVPSLESFITGNLDNILLEAFGKKKIKFVA